MGLLWEHIVLNEIHGRLQHRALRCWRNKRGAEVDFVLELRGRQEPIALECKWQAASFDPSALLAFRRNYPQGENYVVAPDVERAYTRNYTAHPCASSPSTTSPHTSHASPWPDGGRRREGYSNARVATLNFRVEPVPVCIVRTEPEVPVIFVRRVGLRFWTSG